MTDRRRRKHWNTVLGLLLAATLCFIWGNSMLSRENSAQLSGGIVELLAPLFEKLHLEKPDEHMIRKLAHFGEYALLGMELAAIFFLNRGRSLKNACFSALCALAAASADEAIQIFSHRAARITDVLLDLTGAITGILLLLLVTKRKKNGLP